MEGWRLRERERALRESIEHHPDKETQQSSWNMSGNSSHKFLTNANDEF